MQLVLLSIGERIFSHPRPPARTGQSTVSLINGLVGRRQGISPSTPSEVTAARGKLPHSAIFTAPSIGIGETTQGGTIA